MHTWQYNANSKLSLYAQLANYLREQIQTGAIPDGTRLPGRRKLSSLWGVGENTIRTALEQLQHMGLVEFKPKSGFTVRYSASDSHVDWSHYVTRAHHKTSHREYHYWSESESLPKQSFSRDFNFFTYIEEVMPSVLKHYHEGIHEKDFTKFGLTSLRVAIQERLTKKGIHAKLENILICGEALQNIQNICEALMSSGSNFLFEYPNLLTVASSIHSLGMNLIPVKMDDDGMSVSDLEKKILQNRQRCMLNVDPAEQCPTGIVMSQKRREAIAELINKYKLPTLEVDHQASIWRDNPDLKPIKSMDKNENIIYSGLFPTGEPTDFQITWIVADKYIIEYLSNVFVQNGFKGNFLMQLITCEILRSSTFDKMVADLKKFVTERRTKTLSLCEKYLKDICTWDERNCWYRFWIRFNDINTKLIMGKNGINTKILPGFFLDKTDNSHVLLCPSSISEASIEEAIIWLSKLR